nr:hypothetical protein [Chloroflexota bacterium]
MTLDPTTVDPARPPDVTGALFSSAAPLTLSRDEARLLAVQAQGLDRRPLFRNGPSKDRLLETIRALGCVQ